MEYRLTWRYCDQLGRGEFCHSTVINFDHYYELQTVAEIALKEWADANGYDEFTELDYLVHDSEGRERGNGIYRPASDDEDSPTDEA